jgi:hypothetical protein
MVWGLMVILSNKIDTQMLNAHEVSPRKQNLQLNYAGQNIGSPWRRATESAIGYLFWNGAISARLNRSETVFAETTCLDCARSIHSSDGCGGYRAEKQETVRRRPDPGKPEPT